MSPVRVRLSFSTIFICSVCLLKLRATAGYGGPLVAPDCLVREERAGSAKQTPPPPPTCAFCPSSSQQISTSGTTQTLTALSSVLPVLLVPAFFRFTEILYPLGVAAAAGFFRNF